MTYRTAIADSGLPPHEAERLLRLVTGATRADVVAGISLSDEQRRRYEKLVDRRRRGEPLQYLEGSVPFGPVEVHVDPRVLIPRPETERMFELAAAGPVPEVVVDLGTGSGALALAAKATWPDADVYGTDISADALAVARRNGVENSLEVDWRHGDLFAALPPELAGRVDLLVTNPPYVATIDADSLRADVREHEPAMALFAGIDGLSLIRRIGAESARWLASGGEVWCEIAADQGRLAPPCFVGLDTRVVADLTGRSRYVHGTLP